MRNRILQRLEAKRKTKRFQTGGMLLPGGEMEPIPGSDAVEFNGQTHDQGGIMMDNVTEVEDGETMDQVTMSKGGKKKDYFFSSYLKKGGRSYADMHKNILAMGGGQEDIDYLAKMQETAAGRNPNNVKTEYQEGGPKNSQEGNKYQVASDAIYGSIDDEMGTVPDYQPGYTVDGVQMYTGKGDEDFQTKLQDEEYRDAWMKNVDPEVLKAANIESFDDMGDPNNVTAYQKAWNDANPNNKVVVDGKFGEQTFRTAKVNPAEEEEIIEETTDTEENTTTDTEVSEEKKKDYSGALLGLGSMIPAVMAFNDKPDYMESPDLQAPGIVKAEKVAKQHLDRVDFNDQIARNSADAGAMNKFIETSGGGPASMANKMALYAKKQQGDREIKAQEARANTAIANEEANMDSARKVRNANAALDASKFNVQSQEKAASNNTRNKMYVDEFNRSADAATGDRRLNAVQYGINTLASLHRDKLMYQASADVTRAIDGQRGTMPRFNNGILPFNETTTTTTTPEETTAQRGGYRQLKNLRR
jgi:hypothetical protein